MPRKCFVCRTRLTKETNWKGELPDTRQLIDLCATCWCRGKEGKLKLPSTRKRLSRSAK